MKCPHCNKEIEESNRYSMLGTILANIMFFSLPVMFIVQYIALNVEDGYSANYSVLILVILMVLYGIYAFLSLNYNIFKGKFLITNLLQERK